MVSGFSGQKKSWTRSGEMMRPRALSFGSITRRTQIVSDAGCCGSRPSLSFSEYNTSYSTWKKKLATFIIKRASLIKVIKKQLNLTCLFSGDKAEKTEFESTQRCKTWENIETWVHLCLFIFQWEGNSTFGFISLTQELEKPSTIPTDEWCSHVPS